MADKNTRKEYSRNYYQKNKETIRIKKKEKGWDKNYCKKNKEKIAIRKNKNYLKNKEKIKIKHKEWYEKNKKTKKYRKYCNEYSKRYNKNKRQKDPKFRLENSMTMRICSCLKGKKAGRKWETLVGYTAQDLMAHLEKQFDEKMNWQNYGSYWHIDHIVPKSWFPYQTAEEQAFKNCWGLANLQPLEATINMLKGNRYVF